MENESAVLSRAESLAKESNKGTAKFVFEHLVNDAPLGGGTVPPPTEITAIKPFGKQVGVLSVHPNGSVNVQLNAGLLTKKRVAEFAKLVTDFLSQT